MKKAIGLIFYLLMAVTSLAQSPDGQNQETGIFPKSPHYEYPIFAFPNVNKIPYYYDKGQLEKIFKLRQKKQWEKLYKVLYDYVSQFGIENFYKDTYLLWQLAKLTETYGNLDEAKALYSLVLKHHRNNIDLKKIEIKYDSLSSEDVKDFVPIDYYYDLVDYRKNVDTIRPPQGQSLNMGLFINSTASDYGPTLSLDNKTMIFTSMRNKISNPLETRDNEDLFYSHKVQGVWQRAKPLKKINSPYNEGSACLSPDGKTLYFARCGAQDGYGNCDLYVTHMQNDSTWTTPRNLGYRVNSKTWDSHPAISHTGDTLFFASDRLGGFGLSDIYYTYKDKEGNWVPALNAGPIINTRGNEVSPFYHPKYPILYFSSNGQLMNFGEFDIYKTYQKGKLWSEPQNIGPLVNGAGSEFYFTIDSESKDIYYAKAAENDMDNMDLYSFPLPMSAQPLATKRVVGSLKDSITGTPFQGIVSIIDLDKGIEVAPKFLRKDGSFEFSLIDSTKYLIVIQGEKFFRIEDVFKLHGDTTINKVANPISRIMQFKSINFEKESAELRPDMYAALDKIADFLLDHPEFKLRITGHTDSSGDERFNTHLSSDRANNIRDYLISFYPIQKDRISAEGLGNTRPVVKNEKTEADREKNRRVEFEIYRAGDEKK